MPVTIPHTIVPNTLADAAQVDANFLALKAKFDGGIQNDDISSSANITGNKMAPNTITGSKIALGTVTGGGTSGNIAQNTITGYNIAPNGIGRNQVSISPGTNLILGNLDMVITPIVITNLIISTGLSSFYSTLSVSPHFTTAAGFWNFTIQARMLDTSTIGVPVVVSSSAATQIPTLSSTREILSWYATSVYSMDFSGPNHRISWNIRVVSIAV